MRCQPLSVTIALSIRRPPYRHQPLRARPPPPQILLAPLPQPHLHSLQERRSLILRRLHAVRVSSTDSSPLPNSLTPGALPNIISQFPFNGGVQQAGEYDPDRPFSNIGEQDLSRLWAVGCQRDRRRCCCVWVCVTRQLLSIPRNSYSLILPFHRQSFFHVDCFKCAKCGDKVTADTNLLLLSDGSPICANCSYCCNVCKLPILDEAIMTGDDSYHAHCFKCKVCGNRIDELVFAKTSQGIYCMNCHNQRVARSRRRHQEKKAAQAQAQAQAAANGTPSSSGSGRSREAQNVNASVSIPSPYYVRKLTF